MSEPRPIVWKVIHTKNNVETVYLVAAISSHEAKTAVLDSLYERTFKHTWSKTELANDVFGLRTPTGEWTNAKLCRDHGCSINASPWVPEEPYMLYSFNTRTGEMVL